MKFKKVEIQAFRSYDKLNNGTFDFTLGKDDLANFVSIYAPNGFGKTSFYDAVEYGVTNSISRLIKKHSINKDIAKNERAINDEKKGQLILRNRNSDPNLESKIFIQTNGNKKFERQILNPKRVNSCDFHFDKKLVVNEYFQTVVLSQEWIDAFLREDHPDKRYDKFIKSFGDTEIDDYYQKILLLIEQNGKNIRSEKKRLDGIQKKLDFSGDKNILTTVNTKIQDLIELGEKLDEISEFYTEVDSLKLSNTISKRLSELNDEKINFEGINKSIEHLFSGTDELKSIHNYFEIKNELGLIEEREIKLNKILNEFGEISKFTNELNTLLKLREKLQAKRKEIEQIESQYPKYTALKTNLDKRIDTEDALLQNLSNNEDELSKRRASLADEQAKIDSFQTQISLHEKNKSEIPNLEKELEIFDEQETELKSKNLNLELIENLNNGVKILELKEGSLKKTISDLRMGVLPSLVKEESVKFEQKIERIKRSESLLKSKKELLDKKNKEISEQKTLSKDIEVFIAKGAEIINQNRDKTCPLCTHEHPDFQTLAKKVTDNSLLSDLSSKLLTERSELQTDFDKFEKELKKLLEGLIEDFEEESKRTEKDLFGKRKQHADLEKSRKEIETDIERIRESRKKIFNKINNLEIKVYLRDINDKLSKLNADLKIKLRIKEEIKVEIEKWKEGIAATKEKLEQTRNDIAKIKADLIYSSIISFFEKEHPNKVIAIELITNHLSLIKSKIEENKNKDIIINDSLDKLRDSVKSNSEGEVKDNLKELLTKKESILSAITLFDRFLSEKLQLNTKAKKYEDLAEILEKIKISNANKHKANDVIINAFKLLQDLKKNVEPYLKFAEAKREEKEIKERMNFLKNRVKGTLESERIKVAKKIDEQINSFFYEDLINDIYKRIDPHPDYDSIKFICDFKGGKPKLNVCVFKKGEDEFIMPNLYFSTAQLNIMSLSIFLAKALNAEDEEGNPVDCIFIDDPIQSMDSINILSTIDLLRSLVVNHQKQIILSTHEENFHNLLKKKIPSGLFKSKYFELESFGKVKQEM